VLNPHDDGISLDRFVDWMIEAGQPIQRIDDYDDWLSRFETALRALPEKQRELSSLPLIRQLREPAPPTRGSSIPADRFHSGVRELGVGPHKDIPHVSAALIRKYLDDLKHLELI
jgi:fatty acid CoA ligase FadD9